jgi:hypothetical protein
MLTNSGTIIAPSMDRLYLICEIMEAVFDPKFDTSCVALHHKARGNLKLHKAFEAPNAERGG